MKPKETREEMIKTGKNIFTLAAMLFGLCSVSCMPSTVMTEQDPPGWMQSSLERLPKSSSQMLLVTQREPSVSNAILYVLEKHDNTWRNAFSPLPALIGEKGFAPPGEKKEGDRKTPSGVFALRRTFGYASKIDARMPYRQAREEDIWVDDPSSPEYNLWVQKSETAAGSFEIMKRKDDRYKYGIIIEYNTDPIVKGAGSALFIHIRGGENMPTLGCVALSESAMLKVIRWLNPATEPVILMGTKDSLSLPIRAMRSLPDGWSNKQKR